MPRSRRTARYRSPSPSGACVPASPPPRRPRERRPPQQRRQPRCASGNRDDWRAEQGPHDPFPWRLCKCFGKESLSVQGRRSRTIRAGRPRMRKPGMRSHTSLPSVTTAAMQLANNAGTVAPSVTDVGLYGDDLERLARQEVRHGLRGDQDGVEHDRPRVSRRIAIAPGFRGGRLWAGRPCRWDGAHGLRLTRRTSRRRSGRSKRHATAAPRSCPRP